jgi:hypothetical protein
MEADSTVIARPTRIPEAVGSIPGWDRLRVDFLSFQINVATERKKNVRRKEERNLRAHFDAKGPVFRLNLLHIYTESHVK